MTHEIVNGWKFYEYRRFARYTKPQCAVVFGVSIKTINNWESGRIKPPRSVLICLLLFAGKLDFLGKQWQGFAIRHDCIEAPNGQNIWHYEISGIKHLYDAAGLERWRFCRALAPEEFHRQCENIKIKRTLRG